MFLNQGGSNKIDSQIFPDFVQVQTLFSGFHGIRTLLFEFTDKDHKLLTPSCNMRVNQRTASNEAYYRRAGVNPA
jgi:hypothetical protein